MSDKFYDSIDELTNLALKNATTDKERSKIASLSAKVEDEFEKYSEADDEDLVDCDDDVDEVEQKFDDSVEYAMQDMSDEDAFHIVFDLASQNQLNYEEFVDSAGSITEKDLWDQAVLQEAALRTMLENHESSDEYDCDWDSETVDEDEDDCCNEKPTYKINRVSGESLKPKVKTRR